LTKSFNDHEIAQRCSCNWSWSICIITSHRLLGP